MVGNIDKTFPPDYLTNHGGEFMVGNFGAPRIMVGNLGIPHHAWWGFYAKTISTLVEHQRRDRPWLEDEDEEQDSEGDRFTPLGAEVAAGELFDYADD
mgnify:CR=1 FL=1